MLNDKNVEFNNFNSKESETILKTSIESLPFDVFIINKDGYYTMQNSTCKKHWGDVVGKRPEEVASNEKTLTIWKENNSRAFSGETVKGEVSYEWNGETHFFYNIISPVYINNEIQYIFGINIEITEIKETKQKLQESEKEHREIIENLDVGFFRVSLDDIILTHNRKYNEILGIDRSLNLIGEKMFNFWLNQHEREKFLKELKKDGKVKNYIVNAKKINGETIVLQGNSHLIRDNNGNSIAIEITIIDITERRQIEIKLKESEAKYYNLFELSPDGVVLTDLNGNILEVNSALENLSGYSLKEFLGKNFMSLDIFYEDAKEVLIEGYRKLLNENLLATVEFPIKTKENKINWVQVRSNLINLKGKNYILSVIHDITTFKEIEEAVRKNEEKFRDILETSSVGVMEFDVINKKLLYINPKLLNMIGFNKEELNEEIFRYNIIHPKDLVKLLKSNEERELEFQIKDKKGKLKWLAGKTIPHFDENGEIDSIRVWLDDITEKKMYENMIYELNINFLNFSADIQKNIDLLLNTCLKLLDGSLILYVYKNVSDSEENYQVITSENKTYNYNSEEFNQLFVSELFQEEHDFPQTFTDIDRMKYAETDPFILDHQFKGCFGKVIKSHAGLNGAACIFYRNNPILSGIDKLVLFFICDALEIEQRRWQVQKDLEKQNITLSKINKLKSELFSRTSHELKTPLISIKGFTQLLLTLYKSKLDPEVISILKEISDGSKRLEKIINLLLDSTKLEAGQLSLNLRDEDLAFLIRFCVKELQGLAKLRKQTISLNLPKKLETKFDKERIYEVMSNLLVNAIKYTPPGGEISIESKKNDGSYEISIKDNGIGFTEEEKNLVFRQFGKIERYGQGWDIAADGTGLGLYITKKLVELHGGRIWLESKGRNKGTIFHFSLPILK
ncbi:MAG: PAS domain S-box protein [Promethearchaeota archaeon]